ncbi:hypothetical protein FG386_001099 [Cryptosporidium ryanae]|uniref:uncharacterized protein n=1 Tax=Cryptosporidium ryanae TaxID=515981 RepID=UPI00351A6C3D|nr:hypothetical protein FG386_001099 [Cryptosporidium ryanae]
MSLNKLINDKFSVKLANYNKCDKNILLSDEFNIKKIILDFEKESQLNLTDEKIEEIIFILTKGDYFLDTPINNVVESKKLSNLFIFLNNYFKIENCNNCINHGILAFKAASEVLITVPNSLYLFYIPLTDKKESCPLTNLCFTFEKLFYGENQNDIGLKNEILIDILTNYIDIDNNVNLSNEKNNYYLKSTIILEALSFIEIIFMNLDNLSYNYDSDLRMSENFLFCSKFILNTFLPPIQAIISSKIMAKNGYKNSVKLNKLRIKIFKIFERFVVSFYKTELSEELVKLLNTELVNDQSTIMESLMDILSPDFPNWCTKDCNVELKQELYIKSLQLQYHALSFFNVLCNYFKSNVVNFLLTVRKTHIPMDKLPDFISKNNFCFSDITDKLDFDDTQSIFESSQDSHNFLPQYCNSIFSNFYYRIVSNALYNGFKLQQSIFDFSTIEKDYINETIIGKETYNLSKLYKLKLDIFLTSVRIIAFFFNSIVTFSYNKSSNKDYNHPLLRAMTPFTNFLIWICEFVFDYKNKIPQLFNILEEINMIKIRMPILTNTLDSNDENFDEFCNSHENKSQNTS